jgi:hypothetical protein
MPLRTDWRHALLCLLLLGVLLHGHAGVLRQLLGAAHWHTQAGPAQDDGPAQAGWMARAQAWRIALLTRSPLAGGHAAPGHHHDGSERHHHDRHDSTVVALERGVDSSDPLADAPDPLAGSLLQPLALAGPMRWPGARVASQRWPSAAAAVWRDAGVRLPDRPPRA